MHRRSPLLFTALFAAWAAGLYAVSRAADDAARVATARTLAALVGLANDRVAVQGTIVQDAHRRFDIVSDCTGVFPLLLFTAGVLATPAPWRRRGLAIALGALTLLALNQLRLITLWIVRGSAPEAFDFVHVYLWQPALLAAVVVGWLLWLQRIRSAAPLTAAQ